LSGMTWVRILVGAIWLNGALEKFLNPDFPQQFRAALEAGGYVAQAPLWFQSFMTGVVVPNAELFAQLIRFGELALGLALILGLLTNLAALGSMLFSLTLVVSQGGVQLGTGLATPGILTINMVLALLSLIILLSAASKRLSLDAAIAGRNPKLAPPLVNRQTGGR
jgi:thiosulfate dehydrogenase [quinone] large subunit